MVAQHLPDHLQVIAHDNKKQNVYTVDNAKGPRHKWRGP